MNLTMVDGKVCQALSDTPAIASYYIHRAKPTEINYLDHVKEKTEMSLVFLHCMRR